MRNAARGTNAVLGGRDGDVVATDVLPLKIALVGSSGGHLVQLLALSSIWRSHERFWVTFDKPDARSVLAQERVYTAAFPTNRHVPNLLRNTLRSIAILLRERPNLIMSTGAAVAIPYFILGRLIGAKLVYMEVFDRIDSPTVTGRICARFAHVFALQWPEQRTYYPDAVVIGSVL